MVFDRYLREAQQRVAIYSRVM